MKVYALVATLDFLWLTLFAFYRLNFPLFPILTTESHWYALRDLPLKTVAVSLKIHAIRHLRASSALRASTSAMELAFHAV